MTRSNAQPLRRQMMKRALSLLAVILVCAMCILPVAAEQIGEKPHVFAAGENLILSADASPTDSLSAGTAQEDDMKIDIPLTTTLIISICSVLIIAVIVMVVILGRRNRD